MTTEQNEAQPDTQQAPPAATPAPPAAPAAAQPPAAAPAAPDAPWHSTFGDDDTRKWMEQRGLLTDEPIAALEKAVQGHRNAEKRLGKPAEKLMDRRGDNQPVNEFLRANAEMLGLPDDPSKYELERPEVPDGIGWNAEIEAKLRQAAFEEGMHPAAVNRMIALRAEQIAADDQAFETRRAEASQKALAELKTGWGDQTDANVHLARQGWGHLADKAGLDPDSIADIQDLLSPKTGDAAVIRLGHAIGQMLGEDTLTQGGAVNALAMTPGQARQKLAEMDAPDGAYAKARAGKNRAELNRIGEERQRLIKLAAG